MKLPIRKLRLALALPVVAGALLFAPAIVFAHGDEDLSPDSGKNANSSQRSDKAGDDKRNDALKSRAAQLLEEKRQTGKQHSKEQRHKTCTTREAKINERMSTLGTHAQKYLSRYDAIFAKVQAYQAEHQLAVSNYDALLAEVVVKQSAAKSATDNLTALAGTKIDCSADDPASSLASVKTAAKDAKSALHEYRKSLKTLILALLEAKKATASTDDGGAQ